MITQEQVTNDFNQLALFYKEYNPKVEIKNKYGSEFRIKLNESLELYVRHNHYPSEYCIGAKSYFQSGNYSKSDIVFTVSSKAKDTRLVAKIKQLIPEMQQKAQEFIDKQQKKINQENAHSAKIQRIMNAVPELRKISEQVVTEPHLVSGNYQRGVKVTVSDYLGTNEVKLVGLTEEQTIHILQYFHSQK